MTVHRRDPASPERPGDFYLLGAGFSKAINSAMPILAELGQQVIKELGLDDDTLRPFGGSLEEWLAHIAADEPWQTEGENLRNRACFLEASEAVYTVIGSSEEETVSVEPPDWLLRLSYHWADQSCVLTTFNYDLLIERMITSLRIAQHVSHVYGAALVGRTPPDLGARWSSGPPKDSVPTIYKLHGSRDWYYGGPEGPVTEPITLVDGRSWWGDASAETYEAKRKRSPLFDGLVPMVIPPTGTKTTYYLNRALRAQWRRAAEDLRRADRIVVIGYSFPPSDLQARHFIATNVQDHQDVVVVDRSVQAVKSVRNMLGRPVHAYTGENAVASFAADEAGALVTWRTVKAPGGTFRPEIRVGDADVTNRRGDVPEPAQYSGDLLQWLRDEVEGRWKGITDRAAEYPRRPDPAHGNEREMVAYLPR